MEERSEQRATRRPRRPPAVDAVSLEQAALAYLTRFASSAEHLRRVLMRRVHRAAEAGTADPERAARDVETTVERMMRSGFVDDRAYAEARTASLRRRGASARTVRLTLASNGIDADDVKSALDLHAEREAAGDAERAETAAAVAFARRRRLGPWRRTDGEPVVRARELAAMARAGFAYDLARRVVDAPDAETLEALARPDR